MKSVRAYLLIAFSLGGVTGAGLTFISLRSETNLSGFSLQEAQSKLGRRVKLKSNVHDDEAHVINTGTVAYIDEKGGVRYLVIDWDEQLPGMRHRITSIDRDVYGKVIIEE
jgi:hypothetical protein